MKSIIYMKFAMGDRAATTFEPPFGKRGFSTPGVAGDHPKGLIDPQSCSQEAGGNNCPWSALRRRHSTNSSAKVTLEVKAMKHTPAKSNNSKPMKLRSQTTLAIEHIEMTSSSRE